MHDQNNDIAALDRLHAGGWNVGDTAFFDVEDGGQVWVVTGTNGENMIRAEGATCREAWRRALDQAAAVGMLPGRPRPAMGYGRGRRSRERHRVRPGRRGRGVVHRALGADDL